MSKIIVKACIKQNEKKQEEIETKGILQDNRITYLKDKVITIIDINNEKIKRITEEINLIIDLKNEKIITDYIECKLDIKIRIIDKQIEQNRIKVKYKIEDTKDIFEYEMIWRMYETGNK